VVRESGHGVHEPAKCSAADATTAETATSTTAREWFACMAATVSGRGRGRESAGWPLVRTKATSGGRERLHWPVCGSSELAFSTPWPLSAANSSIGLSNSIFTGRQLVGAYLSSHHH